MFAAISPCSVHNGDDADSMFAAVLSMIVCVFPLLCLSFFELNISVDKGSSSS